MLLLQEIQPSPLGAAVTVGDYVRDLLLEQVRNHYLSLLQLHCAGCLCGCLQQVYCVNRICRAAFMLAHLLYCARFIVCRLEARHTCAKEAAGGLTEGMSSGLGAATHPS
jgi:hypothetical protein